MICVKCGREIWESDYPDSDATNRYFDARVMKPLVCNFIIGALGGDYIYHQPYDPGTIDI